MKDGIVFGMVLGLAVGALLFKHSPVAKDIVNKGEKRVMEEINSLVKEVDKKTSK